MWWNNEYKTIIIGTGLTCVHRVMDALGKLQSTEKACVALGNCSCDSYTSLVFSSQPRASIMTRTHGNRETIIVNECFLLLDIPLWNLLNSCLLLNILSLVIKQLSDQGNKESQNCLHLPENVVQLPSIWTQVRLDT